MYKVIYDNINITNLIKRLDYFRYNNKDIGIDICLIGKIEMAAETSEVTLMVYGDNYIDVMTECSSCAFFTDEDLNFYAINGVLTRWWNG